MIIVVEAEDQLDAEAWIAAEPYNAHGGFNGVVVRSWSQVLPEPEPSALRRTLEEERAKIAREPGVGALEDGRRGRTIGAGSGRAK